VGPDDAFEGIRAPIRVAFILPGLHRVSRGAEMAFESIASELSVIPGFDVTLIGSGTERPNSPYRFIHSPCTPREKFEGWPRFPIFRSEYAWEEATFAARLGNRYDPGAYDATITCSYPFLNWLVRLRGRGRRPRNVFVTQNGDWPVQARNSEFRWFNCDALVCTNPVYFELHKHDRPAWLIPNAVDPQRFHDALPDRSAWGLPPSDLVVLMVSALVPSKRVVEGIRAIAPIKQIHLLVAGDGPLREQVDTEGRALMGSRFRRVMVPFDRMPSLYRSADILLHMSQDEPFGNIYVEALAAGLPIVAHDWASTRWLFEDQALLVDTSNADHVRTALTQAIQRRSPDEASQRLALVIRRFSWKSVAQEYARCLEVIVARGRGEQEAAPQMR
jgi:glycosyltransferase involved in cell wall biosynthesis